MMDKTNLSDKQTVVIPKLKKRSLQNDANLDLIISHIPDAFNTEEMQFNSKFSDTYIVNNILFSRTPKNNLLEAIIGVILVVVGIIIIHLNNYHMSALIVGALFLIPGLLTILLAITKTSKSFVLDRMNGLIAYPNSWWYKQIITQFKDLSVVLLYEGKFQNPTLKALTKGFLSTPYRIVNFHPLNFWSFMVWFMDKNRPLPPGDVFDPFRKRDYDRRKAEGFTPPLYRSAVPTPEATTEQQEERERYWHEEDYMCPKFKIEQESDLFDKKIFTDWVMFSYQDIPLKENFCNTWHRYVFKDGKIVYMRTNEQGEGYQPPLDREYKVSVVTIKK